jgi:hypothetical protein
MFDTLCEFIGELALVQLPGSSSATCDHNNYLNINRLSIIDKRPEMNIFALVENDFNELCHVARSCGWPCSAYGATRARERELLNFSRKRKRRNARLTAPMPNTDANNQEAALSLVKRSSRTAQLFSKSWDR